MIIAGLLILAALVWAGVARERVAKRTDSLFAEMYPELAEGDYAHAPEVREVLRRAAYNPPRPVRKKAAPKPAPSRRLAKQTALPVIPPAIVAVAVPAPPPPLHVMAPPVACMAVGNAFYVVTETGIRAEGEYAAIEADDIITSHRIDLSRDPRHNAAYQGRDMGTSAREAKIRQIEAALDPLRYLVRIPVATDGPTLVDADNMALGGNARCIAIKRRYHAGTASAFRQACIDRAPEFGLDPEEVAALARPVIVRRVLSAFASEADKQRFARDTDVSATQNRNAAELARADAEKIDADMLRAFRPDDDGNLDGSDNARFIQAFMARLGASEWQALTNDRGHLSQEGQRRLQAAVAFKAYGDAELIERAFLEAGADTGKTLVASLLAVAPAVLQAAPAAGAFIGQTARRFLDIRKAGRNLEDDIANLSFADDGTLQATSPDAARLLRVFHASRSKKAMTAALRDYLGEHSEGENMLESSGDLFAALPTPSAPKETTPATPSAPAATTPVTPSVPAATTPATPPVAAPKPSNAQITIISPRSRKPMPGTLINEEATFVTVAWEEDGQKLQSVFFKGPQCIVA